MSVQLYTVKSESALIPCQVVPIEIEAFVLSDDPSPSSEDTVSKGKVKATLINRVDNQFIPTDNQSTGRMRGK